MKIINLVENTEGSKGCTFAHGLSFYIETEKHKLLFDLGPSEVALENAERLGIDLSEVDTVVLSHGHYDHSGGIIPFRKINDQAQIFMQLSAGEDYYAYDGEFPEKVAAEEGETGEAPGPSGNGDSKERSAPSDYRYIGIDKEILDLRGISFVDGDYRIDDELQLLSVDHRKEKLPFTDMRMRVLKNGKYVQDEFDHEQFLVISEGEKRVLITGCAHNGILNIMDTYVEKNDDVPDYVIGGFHLMKKTEYTEDERREIIETANELTKYPTKFITCHCTGMPAYNMMKDVMGDQLGYVHAGDKVSFEGAGPENDREEQCSPEAECSVEADRNTVKNAALNTFRKSDQDPGRGSDGDSDRNAEGEADRERDSETGRDQDIQSDPGCSYNSKTQASRRAEFMRWH